MPSDQNNLQQPTEEEALAAFFVACAFGAAYASHKAYQVYKARKLKKKAERIDSEKNWKTSLLDMKAIHEEWNV